MKGGEVLKRAATYGIACLILAVLVAPQITAQQQITTAQQDTTPPTINVSVQDDIIHETGYYTQDGKNWKHFPLNGTNTINGWLADQADATIQLAANNTDNYTIRVYSCTQTQDDWDCHGGWQTISSELTICGVNECSLHGACYQNGTTDPSGTQTCDEGQWESELTETPEPQPPKENTTQAPEQNITAQETQRTRRISSGGGGGSSSRSSRDRAPPAVSATHSPQNPQASGSVTINAQATDNNRVQHIRLRINGEVIKTCESTSCTHTQTYTAGEHTYRAHATDAAGNTAATNTKAFSVQEPTTPKKPAEQFVTVNNQEADFELHGQPFRFAGSNAYYLPNYQKIDPGLVDQTLDHYEDIGVKVVRMWGFYDGYDCGTWDEDENVIQTGPGEYSEEALRDLDRVIAKGKERGIKFIITFTNGLDELGGICQYNTWTGAENPSENMEHFINNAQAQQLYRDYIEMLLTRTNTETGVQYRNEPAIMSWEIINEGRNPYKDPQELRDWYQDTAQYIKSIDSNHLVATGEEGLEVDQDGPDSRYTRDAYSNQYVLRATDAGSSYIQNTAIPEIDYAGAHWFPSGDGMGFGFEADQEMLDAQEAWIKDHHRIAEEHGKPFVLGEYGFPAWGDSRADTIYGSLWQTAEETGIDGDLLWQYTTNYIKCSEYGGNICYPDGRSDQALAQGFAQHVQAMDTGQQLKPVQPTQPEQPNTTQTRIMLLGDSLTQDWRVRNGLHERLEEAGENFDFVGSQSDDWVDSWDSDHEGHPGYTTTQLTAGIPEWLEENPADLILLTAGTNDIAWHLDEEIPVVADRLETTIDTLQQEAPNTTIAVFTIPPMTPEVVPTINRDRAELAQEYNAEIEQRIKARIDAGEDLVFKDTYAALSQDHLTGTVHLDDEGNEKMAQVWYEAVQEAQS